MADLKPCPFCGVRMAAIRATEHSWIVGGDHVSKCPIRESVYFRSKEAAIAAWNRRAADQGTAPPTDGVEKVDGKLWSKVRTIFVEFADKYAKADRYEMASTYADEAARRIAALPRNLTEEDVRRVVAGYDLVNTGRMPGYVRALFVSDEVWLAAIAQRANEVE